MKITKKYKKSATPKAPTGLWFVTSVFATSNKVRTTIHEHALAAGGAK